MVEWRNKVMGLFNDFINQTRKPAGFLGKMMVNGMKEYKSNEIFI